MPTEPDVRLALAAPRPHFVRFAAPRRRGDRRRRLVEPVAAFVVLVLASGGPRASEGGWSTTVARVAESVVSLKLSQLRPFDHIAQGHSTATGFVVDAERGIVLTNRHVVGSGPVRVSATFQNQERVDAVPLYRDPVHDFAFLRYDPAALVYARPQALSLRPEKVATGLDIRVLGSDGGEQLSILPGTIARLDRAVPVYGRYGYNDFNTFYLQAASGTSGGSSGSPVIDADGDVVALNAAANSRTASSFFLPLERVVRALELLRADEPIPRGGLETVFTHRPFRELARLGLDAASEARARAAAHAVTGLLVVEQVLPEGVADGVLEEGDILLAVDGARVSDFVALGGVLDGSVGRSIELELVRGGRALRRELRVADLHALAPSRLLELGDTVLQDMSVQHARAMNRPRRGVVAMGPGYFLSREGVPDGAVIVALDGRAVDDLDDFLDALGAAEDPSRLALRYVVPGRERLVEHAQLALDERWFGARECRRVDDARFWDCRALELPPERAPTDGRTARLPRYDDALLDKVAAGIVRVDFDVPYPTDNVYARHFHGVGLVVDGKRGLVAVDRDTVPVGLGDVTLTFFGARRVSARVVLLHPRHNVALLGYAPEALGEVEAPSLALAADESLPARTTLVGLHTDGTLRAAPIERPNRLTVDLPESRLPRFRQGVIDLYGLDDPPSSLGGPLVDEEGRVHALHASFAYESDGEMQARQWGLPAAVLAEALALHRAGEPYRTLDASLNYRPLADARRLGLPEDWLARFDALDAEARRVLYVERAAHSAAGGPRDASGGTDAGAAALEAGDVLLAIDGTLVSSLFDAERRAQRERLALTVLRGGQVLELETRPRALDPRGTGRLVGWAGALFQMPHDAVRRQRGVDSPGVYLAYAEDGAPATWDGLWRNRFVVAVDGEPVADLDQFLARVGAKGQDAITRLTVVSMSGRRSIVAVQPEYRFWPTFELRREADGWKRVEHQHN